MVFIAVMLAAMLVELHNNQEQYMSMYQKDQQQFIDQLANTLTYMMENGKTEQDIITYMGDEIEASGSRFFVLTKDDSVLFAKNDITTKCLGSLKDKQTFYKSIEQQDVIIQRVALLREFQNYEISVVSDVYSVKAEGNLNKHQYYILLVVAIMSLVLVSLLVTMLGYWNRRDQ